MFACIYISQVFTSGAVMGQTQITDANFGTLGEMFFRLSPEDEKTLGQIVLADSNIQELIKDKNYEFSVQGHLIKGQEWWLDVGGVLKNGIEREQYRQWVIDGRKDKNTIEKYVGILTIGYNKKYNFSIDLQNSKVMNIQQRTRLTMIPELTLEEKERAITIGLNDAQIQQLLMGKNFAVAPGGVYVWTSSKEHDKIGAEFEIWFDKVYSMENTWPWPEYDEGKYPSFPHFQEITLNKTYDMKAITILVDLNQGKVVGIGQRPFREGMGDLYASTESK